MSKCTYFLVTLPSRTLDISINEIDREEETLPSFESIVNDEDKEEEI